MDGMLSDIMEEFNNKNVVFDSEKQTEEFAAIMMNVNNNTRMLDFRGYTPNEIARMSNSESIICSYAFHGTDGKSCINTIIYSVKCSDKRKFIQTIHVRVEVVKNTKNAAAESRKDRL